MSKLEDLRNLTTPVGVNTQHYSLVRTLIEGLFGLRAELIGQITYNLGLTTDINATYDKGSDLKWKNEEGTPERKEGESLLKKYRDEMVNIESQAVQEADDLIDHVLCSQENIHTLIDNGVISHKDILVELAEFKGRYTELKNKNVEVK